MEQEEPEDEKAKSKHKLAMNGYVCILGEKFEELREAFEGNKETAKLVIESCYKKFEAEKKMVDKSCMLFISALAETNDGRLLQTMLDAAGVKSSSSKLFYRLVALEAPYSLRNSDAVNLTVDTVRTVAQCVHKRPLLIEFLVNKVVELFDDPDANAVVSLLSR